MHLPFSSLLRLGILAKRLDRSDDAAIATLCRQCSAFFTLVAGDATADERARVLLESRPPTVALAHKHLIGLERDGALVAIVDLLEDYPEPREWYVGLLLVIPDERARGVGTAVWSALEGWIRAEGGLHVRLIVQEQNPPGALFWRAVGFTASGTVTQHLPSQTNLCWRFERRLGDPAPQESNSSGHSR